MTQERALTWYERIKKNHIDPVVDAISENLPLVITTVTSIVAVGVAIKASNDAEVAVEENKSTLRHIEDIIQTAIETPQIVKVEIGEDLELYGTGNRTD